MSYLNVLSLDSVKLYLRIDDTQSEDDAEIENMIKSSLSFLEKRTNVIVFNRDVEYFFSNGCLRVYDFPINDSILEDTITAKRGRLYTTYTTTNLDEESFTLNVGYEDPLEVPSELIDAAKQMIKVWYYESEKQVNTTLIPEAVKQVIDTNRRFFF